MKRHLHLEQLEDRIVLTAGVLDTTLDVDGKLTTDFGFGGDLAQAIAVDGDGKYVVAGEAFNGNDVDIALARYNADGSLDESFGDAGQVLTDFGGTRETVFSIALDADGRIVVAGSTSTVGGNEDFALVRYNSDGSLDETFDDDGIVVVSFGSLRDLAIDLTIDSVGRIIAAGDSRNGGKSDFAVIRLNTDGSLDETFDDDGKVVTDFGDSDDFGLGVIVDDLDRIIVCGVANSGPGSDFGLVRYNIDGSLDDTFSDDGKATVDFGSRDQAASAVFDGEGRIVVAGSSGDDDDRDSALARLNPDGSLDDTFDDDGKVVTALRPLFDELTTVALDAYGRIVVIGTEDNGSDLDFVLARYLSDGSLDENFSDDGKKAIDFDFGDDIGYRLALDGDGRIIAAGYAFNGTDNDFAVARLIGNSSAAISGDATAALTEDAAVTQASGTLSVTDSDPGEDAFQAPASLAGTFGNFTFNETTGAWTYTLDNGDADTNALNDSDVVTDTLTVTSLDGSASQNIVITITGSSPLPVTIDVRPVVPANKIDVGKNGRIKAKLFSNVDFDATTVDVATLLFAGAAPFATKQKDVNGDGLLDLVAKFRVGETDLQQFYLDALVDDDTVLNGALDAGVNKTQAVEAFVEAFTLGGKEILGSDTIRLFMQGQALRDAVFALAAGGLI